MAAIGAHTTEPHERRQVEVSVATRVAHTMDEMAVANDGAHTTTLSDGTHKNKKKHNGEHRTLIIFISANAQYKNKKNMRLSAHFDKYR
jgi:hypothetical protein